MSHVHKVEGDTADQQIKDLPALKLAAERCGGLFVQDQHHFRTWATDHGRLYGDAPVPAGYTEADIVAGKCDHAIVIPGRGSAGGSDSYEIGVIASKQFPGTFSLMYDYFGGELDALFSTGKRDNPKLDKLMTYYQIEAAKAEMGRRNMGVMEQVQADGKIVLIGTKQGMGGM